MPRHEFRTIEQFVQLLEELMSGAHIFAAHKRDNGESGLYYDGRREAYGHVLDILRNSNLGIVYPPTEQGDKS